MTRSERRRVSLAKKSPNPTLQRKRKKISANYRNKSFDDLKIMIVDSPQKLDIKQSNIISVYLGIYS